MNHFAKYLYATSSIQHQMYCESKFKIWKPNQRRKTLNLEPWHLNSINKRIRIESKNRQLETVFKLIAVTISKSNNFLIKQTWDHVQNYVTHSLWQQLWQNQNETGFEGPLIFLWLKQLSAVLDFQELSSWNSVLSLVYGEENKEKPCITCSLRSADNILSDQLHTSDYKLYILIGTISINVQVRCDVQMYLTNVVVRCPESAS